MAKVNARALQISIEKPVERACRQTAIRMAKERFKTAKEDFLDAFLAHPVSQEIDRGAKTKGTILETEGNLFSFIGFEAGETPIQDLYEHLNENISLGALQYDRSKKRYIFKVFAPSKEEIKSVTIMPWGTARSWAYSIERGISGLNQFLAARNKNLGRSTGGVQAKKVVSDVGQFKPQRYLSDLFNSFIRSL